jgi:hypothetical protein
LLIGLFFQTNHHWWGGYRGAPLVPCSNIPPYLWRLSRIYVESFESCWRHCSRWHDGKMCLSPNGVVIRLLNVRSFSFQFRFITFPGSRSSISYGCRSSPSLSNWTIWRSNCKFLERFQTRFKIVFFLGCLNFEVLMSLIAGSLWISFGEHELLRWWLRLRTSFHYVFFSSFAHNHLTALSVKHWPIAGAVRAVSQMTHHTITSVLFSWEHVFSLFLT